MAKSEKKSSRFKQRLPLIFILIIFVVGLLLFLYPTISNWYGQYTANNVIDTYNHTIQQMGNNAIDDIEKKAHEYNEALAKGDTQKVSVLNYNDVLAVSEAIGYVEVPKIGVYLPIFHGMSDDILQRGVGHMEGTSMPVGGKSTHSVLAGHTGLPSAELFTDLDQLEKGDAFYIHVLDKVLKYEVDQIKTVLPSDSSDTRIFEGKDYVTLLTCTPYGVNSHRLLVRGTRVKYEAPSKDSDLFPVINKSEKQIPFRTLVWYGATALVLVMTVIVILILVFPSRKKRKKKKLPPSEDTAPKT